MRRARGYVFLDAVIAIGLLAVAGSMVMVCFSTQQRYLTRLSDERSAMRLAEQSLVAVRMHESVRDARVSIVSLSQAPPASGQWIRVSATVNGRTSELVGLVPQASDLPESSPSSLPTSIKP